MLLLIKWIVAHLIGDFVLQTKAMVLEKRKLKLTSAYLYIHCLLHGVLIYVISMQWTNWLAPVLILTSHLIIDIWKLYQKNNLTTFLIDQFLHIACLVCIWALHNNTTYMLSDLQHIQQSSSFWLLVTGYTIVIWPLSMMLGLATPRWRIQIQDQITASENSLAEAGRWMGIFERVMVFTFILTNHFEGIGLLITAKSIL